MRPFLERVTAFHFEVVEESFTSGMSARLTNREDGGAAIEGGGREATMLWKRSSTDSRFGDPWVRSLQAYSPETLELVLSLRTVKKNNY